MNDQTLVARMNRLERQLRRTRAAVVVLLVVVAIVACGAGGVGATGEISARHFFVKDAAGKTRASFGHAAGETGLVMMDANGKPFVVIGVSDNEHAAGITISSPLKPGWQSMLMAEGVVAINGAGQKRRYAAVGVEELAGK